MFPFDHNNHIQCHTSSVVSEDNLDNNDEDDDDHDYNDEDDQDNYHNDYDDLEVTSLKT